MNNTSTANWCKFIKKSLITTMKRLKWEHYENMTLMYLLELNVETWKMEKWL